MNELSEVVDIGCSGKIVLFDPLYTIWRLNNVTMFVCTTSNSVGEIQTQTQTNSTPKL